MNLAQQTIHQTKPLQSWIQSTDAHLRKLLARLHSIHSKIYDLSMQRDNTFTAVNEAKMQLANLQLQARREVQGLRPPKCTPNPHVTRLLQRLAASSDPAVSHAIAEFTGADGAPVHHMTDGSGVPMDIKSDEYYPSADPYFQHGDPTAPPQSPVYPPPTPDTRPPSQYAQRTPPTPPT